MKNLTQMLGAVSVAASLLGGARLAASELTKNADLATAQEVRVEQPAAVDAVAAESFEPRSDVILAGEVTALDSAAQSITVSTNEVGMVSGFYNGDTTFGGHISAAADIEPGMTVLIAIKWQEDGSALITGVQTINLNARDGEPVLEAAPVEEVPAAAPTR